MAVISSSSTQHVRHRDGLEDHRVSSGTLTRTQKRRQQRKRREIMSRSLFNAVVSDVTQCDSSAPVVTLPTRHNHYQPPAVGPHNLQHTGESRSHCYSTPSNDSQLDNCMLQIQPVAHCFKESEVPGTNNRGAMSSADSTVGYSNLAIGFGTLELEAETQLPLPDLCLAHIPPKAAFRALAQFIIA